MLVDLLCCSMSEAFAQERHVVELLDVWRAVAGYRARDTVLCSALGGALSSVVCRKGGQRASTGPEPGRRGTWRRPCARRKSGWISRPRPGLIRAA